MIAYSRSSEENTAKKAVVIKFQNKKSPSKRPCCLCGQSFRARTKFDRFCPGCKEGSELYHFHEWLTAA